MGLLLILKLILSDANVYTYESAINTSKVISKSICKVQKRLFPTILNPWQTVHLRGNPPKRLRAKANTG